jgi:predicted DCC family thiol-disulfide oxidoreductase YuxK
MIFDGDCGFCRRWILRWRELTGEAVDYAPYQLVAGRFPAIPLESFKRAVQFTEPGGKRSQGAEAVFRSLSYAPGRSWMLWCYEHVPLVAMISEGAYNLVASHRDAAGRVTQLLWGNHLESPRYRVSSWLFLRVLALIYLIAFVSLRVQIDGLIGEGGILPLAPYLNAVRHLTGSERYWLFPTLSWFNGGDGFLHFLCGGGVLFSLLALLGITPAPCFLLLWVLYLSLTNDCRDFLSFQWDALLLEAGFVAIFMSPFRLKSGFTDHSSPAVFLFLQRWLLFRLMFSSGFVKLASGDQTWRDLTALRYHFETQPLPTWIGWGAQQLPDPVKTAMTAIMFVTELAIPFMIFAPRRLRLTAFGSLSLLQIGIALTGNYAYFNYLTIALCLLLLDDAVWPQKLRRRFSRGEPGMVHVIEGRRASWARGSLCGFVLLMSTFGFFTTLGIDFPWPRPIRWLYAEVQPFISFNRYGLFAIMTTTRPEILVEGSNDGEVWLPYRFKWLPEGLRRRPRFVAPYQPRLDWQMWFAALESYESNPWFVNFLSRLLEGRSEVLALLGQNPFPGQAPKYIRASLYQYEFTDLQELLRTGNWWRREYIGIYFPAHSLPQNQR